MSYDSVLSEMTSPTPVPGRPCVRSHANGGHAGGIYRAAELCRDRDRWVEVRTEEQDWNDALGAFVRVARERRGARLVAVRVDTVRDTTLR